MFQSSVPLPERLPQDVALLQSIAAGHFLFGQYTKALRILQLAFWLDRTNHRTVEFIALVAFRRGDMAMVIQASDRLTKLGAIRSTELRQCHRLALIRQRSTDAAP
jgi:hypothetical protein